MAPWGRKGGARDHPRTKKTTKRNQKDIRSSCRAHKNVATHELELRRAVRSTLDISRRSSAGASVAVLESLRKTQYLRLEAKLPTRHRNPQNAIAAAA